jgi:hypothetical protein
MSETEKQPRPLPRIIMDEAAEAAYSTDPSEVADTFEAAGAKDVASHTLDSKTSQHVKKRGLRELYFKPKSVENEKLYRRLGVAAYNKHINPNSTTNKHPRAQAYREKRLPGGNKGGLPPSATHIERIKAFEDISKSNEAIHIGGLALNIGLELALRGKGAPKWTRAANAAFAVAGNVYPILVQRNNRLRTTRVLERLRSREASVESKKSTREKK